MLIESGSEDKITSFAYLFKSFIHVILAGMIISRIQMPFGSFVSFALSLLLLCQEPFEPIAKTCIKISLSFLRVVFEAPLKELNYDENISEKKTLECCLVVLKQRE